MSAKRHLCYATYEDDCADHTPNPGKRVRGGGLCVECGGFIPNEKTRPQPSQMEMPESETREAEIPESTRPEHTYVVAGVSWTII